MIIDRSKVYDSADDFFTLKGSSVMRLTPDAAISVCMLAADQGLLVIGVEGGMWHNPEFQPDGCCTWTSKVNAPITIDIARKINLFAADDIRMESHREDVIHDVFIITVEKFSISIEECLLGIKESLEGLNGKDKIKDINFRYSVNLMPDVSILFCELAADYNIVVCRIIGVIWEDSIRDLYGQTKIDLEMSHESEYEEAKNSNIYAANYINKLNQSLRFNSYSLKVALLSR